MNIDELPRVAKAVNRWLSYQVLCGREELLSEAYLGHPVAEYLIHRHSGEFQAEVNHPAFENLGDEGRPRQIDYVLRTKGTGAIEAAIECKWIANRSYSRQRILDDVLRLECIREEGRHVSRFLLVAGSRDNFNGNLRELQINNEPGLPRLPFTEYYLPFDQNIREFDVRLRDCADPYKKHLRKFAKSYETEIPYWYRAKRLNKRTTDDWYVAVWQISSMPNRRTFNPDAEWGATV